MPALYLTSRDLPILADFGYGGTSIGIRKITSIERAHSIYVPLNLPQSSISTPAKSNTAYSDSPVQAATIASMGPFPFRDPPQNIPSSSEIIELRDARSDAAF
ncbi:hypothetical protein [Streptosporangium sandarakinum]